MSGPTPIVHAAIRILTDAPEQRMEPSRLIRRLHDWDAKTPPAAIRQELDWGVSHGYIGRLPRELWLEASLYTLEVTP